MAVKPWMQWAGAIVGVVAMGYALVVSGMTLTDDGNCTEAIIVLIWTICVLCINAGWWFYKCQTAPAAAKYFTVASGVLTSGLQFMLTKCDCKLIPFCS